jgi:hypothetical protein
VSAVRFRPNPPLTKAEKTKSPQTLKNKGFASDDPQPEFREMWRNFGRLLLDLLLLWIGDATPIGMPAR